VIEQCPSFMVICPSLEEVRRMGYLDVLSRRFPAAAKAQVPFFRIWCLYEIYYAAKFDKPIGMKGGSCQLEEGPEGQQQIMSFKSHEHMLFNMVQAIDVDQAEATVASDKDMIFDKINSYEEGMAGFNGKVRGVISGANIACGRPELVCASCEDAAAKAVIQEQAYEYFALAAAGGFINVLEDLLLWDDNLIHSHRSQGGMMAVHLAAYGGHLTCLKWLVANGADIKVADMRGTTALMQAAVGGHLTCLQWLAAKGADITVANKEGMTALMFAAWGGHLACLEWLGEKGADVTVVDKIGRTALLMVTNFGHKTCREYLLSKGATIREEYPFFNRKKKDYLLSLIK